MASDALMRAPAELLAPAGNASPNGAETSSAADADKYKVHKQVVPYLQALHSECAQLRLVSGFRSWSDQEALVAELGSCFPEKRERSCAGGSQHHTGRAVDVRDESQQLDENSDLNNPTFKQTALYACMNEQVPAGDGQQNGSEATLPRMVAKGCLQAYEAEGACYQFKKIAGLSYSEESWHLVCPGPDLAKMAYGSEFVYAAQGGPPSRKRLCYDSYAAACYRKKRGDSDEAILTELNAGGEAGNFEIQCPENLELRQAASAARSEPSNATTVQSTCFKIEPQGAVSSPTSSDDPKTFKFQLDSSCREQVECFGIQFPAASLTIAGKPFSHSTMEVRNGSVRACKKEFLISVHARGVRDVNLLGKDGSVLARVRYDFATGRLASGQ